MATFPTITGLLSRFEVREDLASLQESDESYPEDDESITLWKDSAGSNDMDEGGSTDPIYCAGGTAEGSVDYVGASSHGQQLVNIGPLDTPIDVPYTWFIVFKLNSNGVFAVSSSLASSGGSCSLYEEAGGALWWGTNSKHHVLQADADLNWHIVNLRQNGDTTSITRIDGAATPTDVGDAAPSGDISQINFGMLSNSFRANVEFAAVLFYDGEMSLFDIQTLERYLDQQYVLGLEIPEPSSVNIAGVGLGIGTFPQD